MSEAKPTPGPWEAIEKPDADPSEGTHWLSCQIGALGYWRGHKSYHDDCKWILNKADAELIADAGTVHHKTGLTPSQLVARVSELERIISALDNRLMLCAASGASALEAYDSFCQYIARAALAKTTEAK